jgi:4-amino-4-deoxy-L-arabinose transferase-like glycosyltransferase
VPRRDVVVSILQWTIVCWIIVFWRLDYLGLIDDGAHYAQLTHEMLARGSWLVPTLNAQPYIDKPIFFHWVQGLAFYLFGESELSARLPSALGVVGLFVLTRGLGRRLMSAGTGERAWLMLATIPATFALGRTGYLDALFTLCLFGAVGALLIAARGDRSRWRHAGAVLLIFAVMTKGPIAIGLVAIFLLLAWSAGGACRAAVRALEWRTGLAITVLGSAPWFVWMHGRFGDAFIRGYFVLGHLWYLSPRASASSSEPGFYAEMFITVFFPWSLVAAGYLVDTIRGRLAGRRPPVEETLLWLWIATVILVFTIARFRVDRYIYPAAPACCLLAARAWRQAREEAGGRLFAATRASILGVALLLIVCGFVLGWRLPDLGLDVPVAGFLLPVILIVSGLTLAIRLLRHRLRPPALHAPVVALVAVYALVVAIGFPILARAQPIKQVGTWLYARTSAGEAIGVYRMDRWRPTLRYYATHPLTTLDSDTAARAFLDTPGTRWLVTRRDTLASLAVDGRNAEIVLAVPAVVGSRGTGVRRQIWSDVVVVRTRARPMAPDADRIFGRRVPARAGASLHGRHPRPRWRRAFAGAAAGDRLAGRENRRSPLRRASASTRTRIRSPRDARPATRARSASSTARRHERPSPRGGRGPRLLRPPFAQT